MKIDIDTLAQLSIKEFVASGLELYLSMSLAISFFECPDASRRDEQELQTLYTMSWSPALLSAYIVYGHRVSKLFGPAPENFETNLRRSKIFTWIYSLLFLFWDKDMTHKRGPALLVAIIFCVCDLVRFEIEISGMMDDDEEDEEELERLAAAVNALGQDQNGGGDHATKQESMSNSMDSLYTDPQKPSINTGSRQLNRQSTESLSQEYMEMITPAQTVVGVIMPTSTTAKNKKPASLETLKAPPAAPTEISTGHSVNTGESLVSPSLSKSNQPKVFEF